MSALPDNSPESMLDMFERLRKSVPSDTWDNFPTDLSGNKKLCLHGFPKETDCSSYFSRPPATGPSLHSDSQPHERAAAFTAQIEVHKGTVKARSLNGRLSDWRTLAGHRYCTDADVAWYFGVATPARTKTLTVVHGRVSRRARRDDLQSQPQASGPSDLQRRVSACLKHDLISVAACERWFAYREHRDDTAHEYDERFAEVTLELLPDCISDAEGLARVIAEGGYD